MAPATTSHELTSALHAVTTPVKGIMCPSAKGIPKEVNPLQTEPSHHFNNRSCLAPRRNTAMRDAPQAQAPTASALGTPHRKRGLPIPLSPSADKSNHRWPQCNNRWTEKTGTNRGPPRMHRLKAEILDLCPYPTVPRITRKRAQRRVFVFKDRHVVRGITWKFHKRL